MESERSSGDSSSSRDRPTADQRGRYLLRAEWIRAETVINAGLIAVGIYLVQSLLAASSGDAAARISIVAWAFAIPLLAALAMLNVAQESYRYASYPLYLLLTRALAQAGAAVGLVAAFWHIWVPAGIVLVGSAIAALALYAVYLRRLEQDNRES
jgi:hypothetical protein